MSFGIKLLRAVATCLITALLLVAALQSFQVTEGPANASTMDTFPGPEDVFSANLPGFRFKHPRLPAPSSSDIAFLRSKSTEFFRGHARQAEGGTGNLYSAILIAYTGVDHIDISVIHRRLLDMNFGHRGYRVFDIAVGYDWLYERWSPMQRSQLQAHLLEGCRAVVNVIRDQRLSPYNVYLYNRPFQSLMACAISLYRDIPDAGPIMNFAADFWKRRVVPVWKQVMGQTGGWHEGGEYVGIGIGQVVYKVPAMWRRATGEDLFKEIQGLRGFLDFLVYRTRTDGTHFRWGDAGVFDKRISDRIALAMEFSHSAAYSYPECPRPYQPSAWPWGPLTDNRLCDPVEITRLPLVKMFDGIGLVVARTSWGSGSTYVTFKAGDNFWSHSHLDQGAFTIFKQGALAIDSGLYGTKYGSDHHMNYTYQTIAHNVITVTDPEDTVALPGKQDSRNIANDGGQRRVGSGWGIEPAPLDLKEWQSKRDIYHTGSLLAYSDNDDVTVAVADLTAAYTNTLSGKGTFSHRTRRVEHYIRTFGFDRSQDVVVIRDRISITKPNLAVRWLMHTRQMPHRVAGGFYVDSVGARDQDFSQGTLRAHVVEPRNASIQFVGGPGFEFFVDGRNYDDGGQVWEVVKRKPAVEPGAWRVEVRPPAEGAEHTFLIVLVPRNRGGAETEPVIETIDDGNRRGVRIKTPGRDSKWWFTDSDKVPQVEIR